MCHAIFEIYSHKKCTYLSEILIYLGILYFYLLNVVILYQSVNINYVILEMAYSFLPLFDTYSLCLISKS